MIKLFFLAALIISFNTLWAQRGYYSTDSSSFQGIELIDGGEYANAHFCQVKKGTKIINYTPYEVNEYGFSDKNSYYAFKLELKDTSYKVFLEKLVDGETDLYYYKGKGFKLFFIKKDSGDFIIIPECDIEKNLSYREIIKTEIENCNAMDEPLKLVDYKKDQLTKLIVRYNNCKLRPFPHTKYGLVLGYRNSTIKFNKNSQELAEFGISNISDKGYKMGAFIDLPILLSDFSFRSEFAYTHYSISYYHQFESSDIDLLLDLNSIQVPFVVQYTIPTNKIRAYFNFGGMYQYNSTSQYTIYQANVEGEIYQANVEGEIIEIKEPNNLIFPKNFGGYSFGCGLQYKLDYRRWVFIEIGSSKVFSNDYSKENSIKEFNLKTGINF